MKSKKNTYREVQTYEKSVLNYVLLGGAVVFFYVFIRQEYFDNPISDRYSDPGGLAAGGILLAMLFFLFRFVKLETAIDQKGVRYRFFPFHLKHRRCSWKEIKELRVKPHNPVREFGGKGLRYSFKRKLWIFSIKGSMYLEITRKDGKRTLIGTAQHIKLKDYLQKRGRLTTGDR